MSALTTLKTLWRIWSANPSGSWSERCYGQEGEDAILKRLFERQGPGFYVDVGAHHPIRFSNTFYFYLRGWRGLTIEPNPDIARLFLRRRPRDIHLTLGVAESEAILTYFAFNEPALNTFDAAWAEQMERLPPYRLRARREVAVRPLSALLAQHLPTGTAIDILSVDTEGYDLAVLKSNDWDRYRPWVVLAEAHGLSLAAAVDAPVARLLADSGYELFAKTLNTLFFVDRQRPPPWAGTSGETGRE